MQRDSSMSSWAPALSRTYLTQPDRDADERLSEDIDLIVVDHRDDLAGVPLNHIKHRPGPGHMAGSRGRQDARGTLMSTLPSRSRRVASRSRFGCYAAPFQPWPTETREIEQRYRDAPQAILRVPTFAVLRQVEDSRLGWIAGAARDLDALWALACARSEGCRHPTGVGIWVGATQERHLFKGPAVPRTCAGHVCRHFWGPSATRARRAAGREL